MTLKATRSTIEKKVWRTNQHTCHKEHVDDVEEDLTSFERNVLGVNPNIASVSREHVGQEHHDELMNSRP